MPSERLTLKYEIDGFDFSAAGSASSDVKKILRKIGVSPETIRRIAIAMYEAEINTVIHAGGGVADVEINPTRVKVIFTDHGPGIEDIEKAMEEGYSTASYEIRQLGFGAGMGLSNIKKYSDNLDIKSKLGEGTVLTFIVNL